MCKLKRALTADFVSDQSCYCYGADECFVVVKSETAVDNRLSFHSEWDGDDVLHYEVAAAGY
jgi:hypothetical protein